MTGEPTQIEIYAAAPMRGIGQGRGMNQSESSAQPEVRSTARVYNLKTSEDCDDPKIIAGTFQIAGKSVLVLIESESNYSYVSSKLGKELNLPLERIRSDMIVINPLGNSSRLTSLEGLEVSVVSERIYSLDNVISVMSAWKLLLQGCQVYIVNIIDARVKERKLEDILTVRVFPEVFPDDFPGLPPDREVEFQIEVIFGSTPISMAPYMIALKELKELKA
ncbi:uncharacterized protein LOC120133916 [Hibiscus syriacus]|uniref:uncharacterized protein LOC120133916 n=1 Tax=Hibiscus syriacus TaxID=106335 RepID=UPI0019214CA9|nr:uncharacterized protein LOC120133916 [Hibiscus syriacus]